MSDVMKLAVEQSAQLGEGLLWDARTSRWWWTDIESATIHSWADGEPGPHTYRVPDRTGSMALCKSGRILLGTAKQLSFAGPPNGGNPEGAPLQPVRAAVPVDAIEPRTRVNDGRTDRSGNFVFGTLNEAAEKRPIGSFYQYSLAHGLRRLALPSVAIANSTCFSPDGRTMYFTDTTTRRIMQCDYDADSGRVANVRLFVETDLPNAWPDGSVIDRNGCLWNAQWGAARVVQYSPQGELMRSFSLPAKNPTCPAFGGANLDQLMVTTARVENTRSELEQMPLSGSLFTINIGEPLGIVDALFNDDGLEAASK
ncbi:MAG TPA: SMP-30/gluconolactonase/LRE family protein [Pseudoduganella sp.]